MRTLRVAAIAFALATFVSPLRAENSGASTLRTAGVNGRITSGMYLGPYQAVLGNAPGMPAIDHFTVTYLNHSYTGRSGMSSIGGALERYRVATLVPDQFAYTVGTSLAGRSNVRSVGYLMRLEPRTRPKPPVPDRTRPTPPAPGRKKEVITTTPEPEAIFLMGTGLLVLLAFARSRGNA